MNEDPLAQLRDIHVPDPVSWWPPAPGWWIVAILILAALGLAWWLRRQYRARNAYRRAARHELAQAWDRLRRDGNLDRYIEALGQILRRAALVAFPRQRVNGLHGEAWLRFLDESLPANKGSAEPFSQGPGHDLLVLPYRPVDPSRNLEPLHNLVMDWLTHHGPPRTSRATEVYRAAV
ncbi:MAG: DUF4381 domain-containing protein [Cellvibrionaceae bacterium]